MYIGHVGAALGAKGVRRSIGLLVLLVATYTPDWVDTGLCLAGAYNPQASASRASVMVPRRSAAADLSIEIEPGGFFGELALLVPDSPRIARVRARTDARILAVPRETFDLLLENEPSFARALLRELAARLVLARTGH